MGTGTDESKDGRVPVPDTPRTPRFMHDEALEVLPELLATHGIEKPVLVGQFEFVEWTPDNHLRHSRFVALREDKPAQDVRRE